MAALRTPIPRGLRTFVVQGNAVLALKPVNDTEILIITINLPAGFGYMLNELHVNIIQDRAADWEEFGYFEMNNPGSASIGLDYRMPIKWDSISVTGATGLNSRGTVIPAGVLPRTPISPINNTATAVKFVNSTATAALAGTVDAAISFWEYDLQQLQYFPVHMASNVVGR